MHKYIHTYIHTYNHTSKLIHTYIYIHSYILRLIWYQDTRLGRVSYYTILRDWDTVSEVRSALICLLFIDTFMYVYVCVLIYICVSISTMRVCLPYLVLGFDVCPSIQEELQGREMATPSSIVEGGQVILMKTKRRDDVSRVYCIVKLTSHADTNYHTGSS